MARCLRASATAAVRSDRLCTFLDLGDCCPLMFEVSAGLLWAECLVLAIGIGGAAALLPGGGTKEGGAR